MRLQWHIFCRVIDNFGDIGVCWRLAQQLVNEHQQVLTLWVDDLVRFNAICPNASIIAAEQTVSGVQVRHWQENLDVSLAAHADVVVETFACDLPEAWLASMAQRQVQPQWLNLEYLSAEPWILDCHLGCSPLAGMQRVFFFPGFVTGSGGVLMDKELLATAETLKSTTAQQAFLTSLGISEAHPFERRISLFAYENPAVNSLLVALANDIDSSHLLVPTGRVTADVERWLGCALIEGVSVQRGSLTITALPFMSQLDYDSLLAICDLNCVRGEESFVRSQVLGKPTLWHIYPQDENAHIDKLKAFLVLYLAHADTELVRQISALSLHWNQVNSAVGNWPTVLQRLSIWQQHAKGWQQYLLSNGGLASNLVTYVKNRV
jgi:uncharacterized repeat protein (TIGR03837 family)